VINGVERAAQTPPVFDREAQRVQSEYLVATMVDPKPKVAVLIKPDINCDKSGRRSDRDDSGGWVGGVTQLKPVIGRHTGN